MVLRSPLVCCETAALLSGLLLVFHEFWCMAMVQVCPGPAVHLWHCLNFWYNSLAWFGLLPFEVLSLRQHGRNDYDCSVANKVKPFYKVCGAAKFLWFYVSSAVWEAPCTTHRKVIELPVYRTTLQLLKSRVALESFLKSKTLAGWFWRGSCARLPWDRV